MKHPAAAFRVAKRCRRRFPATAGGFLFADCLHFACLDFARCHV